VVPLSLFSDVSIGLSGLNLAQQQMTVVGQNEANANTPGYAAETVLAAPNPLSMGGGAVVLGIQNQDSPFLDQELYATSGQNSYWQEETQVLSQLQSIVAPSGQAALLSPIENFFSAWNTLAANPEDTAARQGVITSAQALVAAFASMGQSLQNEATGLSQSETATVAEINQNLAAVAQLNGEILQSGQQPGFIDQRNAVVQELAKEAGFTAVPQADGTVTIFDQGTPLVTKGEAATITLNQGPPPSLSSSIYSSVPTPSSGTLAALMDLTGNVLPSLENGLNALVQNIFQTVNSQHEAGYDLNGNPGLPFFTGTGTLQGIAVNPQIVANPALVAASSVAGEPANGQNAAAIYNLSTPSAGSPTFDQQLAAVVGNLGITAQAADNEAQNASQAYLAAKTNWQGVSGVNLDQQAADLVLYQRAYQASAEYIASLNTTLGYLMSMGQAIA
jgi:flagellar hook-associated protein 1 FlgK